MLIEEIVEDKGALWTEGIIFWLTINGVSYQVKRVQVADGAFCPCVDVSSGVAF